MRRAEKRFDDKETLTLVMQKADVCRIALSDNNMPYIIPMNFGFDEEYLYLHTAKEGRKLDILKKNQNVCFEIEHDVEIIKANTPCSWGMKYLSVIGFGKAVSINDIEEKIEALNIIVKKYTGVDFDYSNEALDGVEVIKIKIAKLIGKKSGY